MKTERLPLSSWALGVAGGVLGVVFTLGALVTAPFRKGLDADLVPMMAQTSLPDLLGLAIGIGLLGIPYLVLVHLFSHLAHRPERAFVVLAPAIPGTAFLIMKAWFIVQAALEPPTGSAPFAANNVFYLPNWLELATVVAAFLAAALVYRSVSRVTGGSFST